MTATITDDTVQVPRIGRYEIDSRGSTLTFRSRHLFGLAPVHGTMAISHGVVDVADPITDSSVQVEIDTTSFDTGSRQRDGDVRSARFLDAARYPSMTFTSERLDRSEGRWMLAGTLRVRHVARPVSLAIERCIVQPGTPNSFVVCASTRIDRTDFGLTAARGMAGRHLDVSLRILGIGLASRSQHASNPRHAVPERPLKHVKTTSS
jgi:polyisoprenoid-binding protein YceI